MKKILVCLFSLFFLAVTPLSAATHPSINLSDAIYADLALNHYLDNVSVYYSDGKAGDDVKVNETRHWIPASTVKLFAAMYAYKLIGDKTISLSEFVTIADKNDVPTELVTDDLPTLYSGETVTIDRLIRQMLIQSDNTAFNQLLDLLGRDNVTQYVQSLGLVHTHIGSKLNLDDSQTQYEYDVSGYGVNTTTAQDYAKAFNLVKTNKIPGAKELFATLQQQRINNMIPYYLPKNVVCAHKTGDWAPLFHDGGICQDKKREYVLAIFTNTGDPDYVAHLSEIAYSQNYNLVGQKPTKPTISQNPSHPIDPLLAIMPPKNSFVLGASTANFPTPDITAADLGIKASDLNQTIPDDKLPPVILPANSPLYSLVNAWDTARLLVAPDAQARLAINIDIGERHIAEAKQLANQGQAKEAQTLFDTVQNGLQTIVKDPTVAKDPVVQTQLQAISETRFSALANTLQQTKGDQKIQVIQQISQEAQQTTKEVEPNLPDATSAISPSQKALTGTVIATTATTATVRTSGGQEITFPTNTANVIIKQPTAPLITPQEISPTTGEVSPTIENISPTPSISPTEKRTTALQVGSTIALVGSNKDNTFAPTVIIPNVPSELAAPQPVVVAKVTTDHLVVEENGVYTQVNVNQDTTIKAADTNISIGQIHSGDVVVVHGQPLSPAVTNNQSQTTQPSTTPTITTQPDISTTQPQVTASITPSPTHNDTKIQPTSPTPTSIISNTPHPSLTGVHVSPPTQKKIINPTGIISAPQTNSKPSTPSPTTQSVTPKIIQSTSIQVIEKKSDVNSAPPQNSQPKPAQNNTQSQQQQPPHQDQPKSAPPPQPNTQSNTIKPSEQKKK